MTNIRSVLLGSKIVWIAIFGITNTIGLIGPALSESSVSSHDSRNLPKETSDNTEDSSVKPPPLPNNGIPLGRRRGGTSRNQCPAIDLPLTALVPGQDNSKQTGQSFVSFLASTVSEYPTVWIYIPKSLNNYPVGEFILQNEAGKDIYRKSLELPETEGIIGINLPTKSEYSLAIGKKYHWYFKIYCGEPNSETAYYYVDSWIQRVTLTPEFEIELNQVNNAIAETEVASACLAIKSKKYWAYFEQNIWYDTLTVLGKLLQANPSSSNLQEDWSELLQSIDLSNITQKPILKIYQ